MTEQIINMDETMSRSVVLLLEEHLERIRRGEVDRLFRRLQLSAEERNAVDALSRSIVDGIMQTPLSMLTAASEDTGAESLAKSASRLFSLGQDGVDIVASDPQLRHQPAQIGVQETAKLMH